MRTGARAIRFGPPEAGNPVTNDSGMQTSALRRRGRWGREAGPLLRAPTWVPAHRFIALWLLLTAPVLAFPVPPVAPRLGLVALHLVVALILLRQPLDPGRLPGDRRVWGVARDWLPLLALPLFYWETPLLAETFHRGMMYDWIVYGWEQAVFRGQPSQTLAARWPSLWLSELLHGAYLSYYFIALVPPTALYLMKRRGAFRRVVFTTIVALIVHQAAFAAFPVLGPRYLFPAPSGPLEAGVLYQLTHRLLEGASSPGTAFPSSHVGISVAVTIALFREGARAAPWVALLTTLLAISTVYGGFHYAVDAVAGVALGGAAALAAPGMWRWLRTARRPRVVFGT
jgi:membrane-associated phospholipid phosphatase